MSEKRVDNNINKIADNILNQINQSLYSDHYQSIIQHQNEGIAGDIYPPSYQIEPFPLLPAVGINYDALTERITSIMKQKFKISISFINDKKSAPTIIKKLRPPITIPDPGSYYTDASCFSYLPYDIDQYIQKWLQSSNNGIITFLEEATNDYGIFHRDTSSQRRYMQLDLFFTALHKKLQNLPEAKRIAEDFSKSIYVNPNFVITPLSEMFPFYSCNTSNHTDLSNDTTAKIGSKFKRTDYPLLGETIREPDSINSQKATPEILSRVLEKYINDCTARSKTTKILKICFPLYIFLFNNVLTEQIKKDPSVISKVNGCSLNNPNFNLSPLEEILKLRLNPLKNMKLDNKRIMHIKSNLYTLRQFDNYIQAHPYIRFSYDWSWKVGNSKESSVQEIDVLGDPLFTTWLFIHYSELFRIALMPNILNDDVSKEKIEFWIKCKISPPKNFFTAFNFEKKVFQHYPTFHNEYNDFLEKQGTCLFKKYNHLSVKQWLDVARLLEEKITYSPKKNKEGLSPWYDLARVELHEILISFYNSIGISEESNFREIEVESIKRFEKYYSAYKQISLSES